MLLLIAIVLIGFVLLIFMVKEAFSNRVLYHELYFRSFPTGFEQITIFFISDIHRRKISDKIIDETMGQADIVIIGGDLTEKGVPFTRVETNIKKLKKIAPVYFVWGNNDYEVDRHLLDTTLLDLGVKILDNTAVSFESTKGEQISLLGIDDMAKERDRLDLALLDAGMVSFKILVSHNPEISHKVLPEHQIEFILSGHTHGGQIRLFGYGPYELGSIKQLPQTTILTSNGYGTTSLPLRLGAKSETHLIMIRNGETSGGQTEVK